MASDGGPAYPQEEWVDDRRDGDQVDVVTHKANPGLSKLEWFAGMATIEEADRPFELFVDNAKWAGLDCDNSCRGVALLEANEAIDAKIRFVKAVSMLVEAEKRRRDGK